MIKPAASDDALKRAFAELAARDRSKLGVVTPEELLRIVQRTGTEESRLELLSRVAADPAAQRDLALLQSAQALAPRPTGVFLRVATAAIAASLVASLGVWKLVEQRDNAGIERGSGSVALALIAPAASAPAITGAQFVWHAVPAATRYLLEIADDQGVRIWNTETRDTVVVVPDSISLSRASLWYVTATTPSGTMRSTPRAIGAPSRSIAK